jgi:hypothetical protein
MGDAQQLTVIEQREIGFYDDEIIAVKVEDGTIYAPIRPICTLLGVQWNAQFERINREPILLEVGRTVRVTRTEGERQVTRELFCLPIDYLNGWLFGINVNRVKERIRPKLLQYQREVYRVLYEAFGRNEVTAAPDPLLDALRDSENPAAIAYRQAMAIANIARQQLLIETRIHSAETHLADHENRLQIIEADRGDDSRYITNAQAVQIAQAVKQIALELGRRSKRNEFGGVYGELHRQFSIPGYKQLPAAKFQEAINFLGQWWESLTDGSNIPF